MIRPALRSLLLALCLPLSLGAFALPAQAQTQTAYCSGLDLDEDGARIAAGLAAQGYSVSRLEEWGGCVRAFVVTPEGTTGMAYFDPASLQRVN